MNIARIRHAIAEIERLEKALGWLESNGHGIANDMGDERVSFTPNFASACPGSSEAGHFLSLMMANRLPDLVQEAIENCRNTIEIHKQTIRSEIEALPAPTD